MKTHFSLNPRKNVEVEYRIYFSDDSSMDGNIFLDSNFKFEEDDKIKKEVEKHLKSLSVKYDGFHITKIERFTKDHRQMVNDALAAIKSNIRELNNKKKSLTFEDKDNGMLEAFNIVNNFLK